MKKLIPTIPQLNANVFKKIEEIPTLETVESTKVNENG